MIHGITLGQDPSSLECDFEEGSGGWEGDGKVVNEGTALNRVNSLKKSGSNTKSPSLNNKLVDQINTALDAVRAERKKLFQNPEVIEDLLQ